jgi:phosphocarrier protein
MSEDNTIAHRDVLIVTEYGLHLRPADLFARTASRFAAEIRVSHNGQSVNGKSILDLATLAAECGTTLSIHTQGPDAKQALDTLCRLVESDFRPESVNPSSQAI